MGGGVTGGMEGWGGAGGGVEGVSSLVFPEGDDGGEEGRKVAAGSEGGRYGGGGAKGSSTSPLPLPLPLPLSPPEEWLPPWDGASGGVEGGDAVFDGGAAGDGGAKGDGGKGADAFPAA